MKYVLSFLFTIVFATAAFAQDEHSDVRYDNAFKEELWLVFETDSTPEGFYESFTGLRTEVVTDETTGEEYLACVIGLRLHELPEGMEVPRDDFDQLYIRYTDDSFISTADLYEAVDPHTCKFYVNYQEEEVTS